MANEGESNTTIPESVHCKSGVFRPSAVSAKEEDDEREATELGQVAEAHGRASGISGDAGVTNAPGSLRGSHVQLHVPHWYDPIKKFWKHQIQLSLPHDDCRDHLVLHRVHTVHTRKTINR
ncbi:hypothetical protein LTR66_011248 [Elasticomyces elasticus]|nr:hypothetical protein LTR66_011248 [Elasticomyces elasticus]